MKRVLALLLASSTASWSPALGSVALAATPKAATSKTPVKRAAPKRAASISYKDLAPADEYFGPLKLSILGIKNTTSDAGKRYVFGMRDAQSTLSMASFVDASVHDWARKYPRDREVARALYFLQRLYAMIDSDAAKAMAKNEASWMYASYGSTPQARVLRRVLASAPVYVVQPSTAASAPAPDASPAAGGSLPTEPVLQPIPSSGAPATATDSAASSASAAPATESSAPFASAAPTASAVPTASAAPAAPAAAVVPSTSAPYASGTSGTPFPAPIEPSAAQIDGTPSPAPTAH